LARTRQLFLERLGGQAPDEASLEEMADSLIAADVGVHTAEQLVERLRKRRPKAPGDLRRELQEFLLEALQPAEQPLRIPDQRPFVILVVGVNGSGKTTTLAKIAHLMREEGKRVLVAAADTFRAAAIEQLEQLGRQVGYDLVRQAPGADPAAVAFDAARAARAREVDVLLVDTAGRLHTKFNLMEELKKVRRVLAREIEGAPHEVLLVLDATIGQNALVQARTFVKEVGVTGLAVTKLDGTAKGGAVVPIVRELGLPLRYVGVGEGLEDLQPFRATEFVEALLG